MITVSIDPADQPDRRCSTLPRDTVDVPLPPGPARNVYGVRLRRARSTASSPRTRDRPTAFPGTRDDTRGYNGLKAILGNLYGLDIKYYVEVNFDGFRKVVDALGGVTINVQVPGPRRQLPAARRQADCGCTSRPASST